MGAVHGTESTIPTLSTTESFDFDEHHSNDSTDSFPPPLTPSNAAPLSYSPKQILQKKVSEASIASTVPFSSSPALAPQEDPREERTNEQEEFNPIAVASVSVAEVEVHSFCVDQGERPSDMYSLHSDGIPEHDDEENNNDDEMLTGDGSKPVGCTSCSIQ